MYERQHVQEVIKLVTVSSNRRIIAMTGPRQVGKTTVALQACIRLADMGFLCRYYSSDDPDSIGAIRHERMSKNKSISIDTLPDEQTLVDIWRSARRASLQSEHGLVLFLDEIHLIPNWSRILKGLWDRDRREGYPLHVVILGSAAWRMLTGTGESLTGRFSSLPITHWAFHEVNQVFGLETDEYIFFGGYPGALSKGLDPTKLEDWQRYILDSILRPVTDKDIMGLEHVRKPALMRQLVDLAPRYSGQLISYNKLLGQLQDAGNTTTIARYLDLLSDAYILTALSRYAPAPHRTRAPSPKLNVLNTALMTAQSGYSFEQARADRSFWGRVVESSIGAHLYNTRGPATRIHFWRDPPREVDYVIERGPHVVAIEVKSGKSRTHQGLDAFEKRFSRAKTLMVGPNGVPINEFFSLTTEEWIEQLCVSA